MNYIVKRDGIYVQAPKLADVLVLLSAVSPYETNTSNPLANFNVETAGVLARTASEEVQSQPVDNRQSSPRAQEEWLSHAAAEAREKGEEATSWSFTGIWNKSLEEPEPRTYEPRGYIYASELGKPLADVWLKMKGVEPTNPPNPRSLRKFEAGNIWEWIVALILKRAGILVSGQDRVLFTYDNMVEVSGKMDFIAGGALNVLPTFDDLGLPESFRVGANRIIAHLQSYKEMTMKPLEIKSISSFMFEALERSKKPLAIHRLQMFHYLKGTGFPRGDIIYICRDDCRMMEFPVLNNEQNELEYKTYIEAISEYYFKDEMPPLEDPIKFDEDMGRFSKNNQVAWSPYLTKLYGIQDQMEFDEKYSKQPERWNRVLSRVKAGKAMTKKNLEAIEKIRAAGYDVDTIISKLAVSAEDTADE